MKCPKRITEEEEIIEWIEENDCCSIDEIELKVEPPINLWDSLLEQQQKDILKSQLVWKIYFGAVLQDIREREEEEEKNNCIECNVVITKDNIYEPNDCYTDPEDLCENCGDDYKECVVCNEWCCNEALYFDEDNECKICDTCGNSEFQEIEDNVEKINTFVENYNRGEYIGFYQTEVDAIMKLINKLV